MILLLGGTHETIEVSNFLNRQGLPFLLSVATPLGKDRYAPYAKDIHMGMLDESGFVSLIKAHGINRIIDVTHPHAAAVKSTAQCVAKSLKIPYHGFVRQLHASVFSPSVADTQKAIAFLKGTSEKILVTGIKHMGEWLEAFDSKQLMFRVMPSSLSISTCESYGLSLEQIIAIKTPCPPELNRALFEAYDIRWFVFKNSGSGGATRSNIDALIGSKKTKGLMISPNPSLSNNQWYYDTIDALLRQIEAILQEEV